MTFSPRRPSAAAAADPWAPSPTTIASAVSMALPVRPPRLARPRGGEPFEDQALHALHRDALLRHRVPVADRHGVVLEGIDVDGHAPRRADLVLATVELADRRGVVVDGHDVGG